MKTITTLFATMLAGLSATAAAAEPAHPVVIELFTSQGCSSCPPADALAAEYAEQAGVLVLSYHVDYWDRLGWRDPHSSAENTARQNHYAGHFGTRRIYTPQAVVQGTRDVVGSDARSLKRAVAEAATSGQFVAVSVTPSAGGIEIAIPQATTEPAHVLLIGVQKHSENAVPRGENSGRTLSHRNSVTQITALGSWDGKALRVTRSMPSGDGAAVLLQSTATGAIIGAGWL